MANVAELKSMIVDLKMQLVRKSVPEGHCPYAYYRADKEEENEPCDDCTPCKRKFMDKMKEKIQKEVEAL